MRTYLCAFAVVALGACVPESTTSLDATELPDWVIPPGESFWKGPRANERLIGGTAPVQGNSVVVSEDGEANGGRYHASLELTHMVFRSLVADAEVVVSTASIAAGDRHPARSSDQVILGNTAQTRWSDVVEHREARDQGVELSWIYREPVEGPIVVEVALDGLPFIEATPHALHYGDPSSERLIGVTHAVAVEAQGQEWQLSTTGYDGGFRVEMDADAVADVQWPLAIDPLVFPERRIDDPEVLDRSYSPNQPKVAWSGQQGLMA